MCEKGEGVSYFNIPVELQCNDNDLLIPYLCQGPVIIDGVPASEMTRDQIEGHVGRLQAELQRERDERNFYQLERDRIGNMYFITCGRNNNTNF